MGSMRAGDRAAPVAAGEDETLRAAVVAAMARLREGDEGAVWALHEVARPHLERLIRAECRRLDLHLSGGEVAGLVLDAALELGDLAGAWRPDGALPWVWALQRIRSLVHREVGWFVDPLEAAEAAEAPGPPPAPVEDPLDVLDAAARRHPAARALRERLRAAASERDARIWVAAAIERGGGNRAPAVTVGAAHDLAPATVRKVLQRVGERMARVA